MKKNESEKCAVKVQLTSHRNSVYKLAYILVDVNQLLIISKLIEEKKYDIIEMNFVKKRFISRYSTIMNLGDEYEITDISSNCITLIIAGINTIAMIVLGIANLYFQKKNINRSDQPNIIFQIDNDFFDTVSRIIDRHIENHGIDALDDINGLLGVLRLNGYLTDFSERDTYIISKGIEKTVARMAKIVYRTNTIR